MRAMKVADLFCGAGGSSTGAQRAIEQLGLRMDLLCINHWPVAIDTHKRNHPEARHYCQDVATVRPHLVVPEGHLDLLMASPTCTHHSRARGGKPISDQQRQDPWHIITWLTELRVRCLIIENVPEFTWWGPVNPRTGKALRSRRGEYFLRWLETIRGLGFDVDWRILNAADFGDATTRERFFLIARSDHKPLHWPETTHARRAHSDDLLGTALKQWRPAREIIDWAIAGKSIFNRKRPLSPKTLARIYAGAVKFRWPEPFLVVLRQHMDARSLEEPIPTVCANGQHIALAQPFLLNRHGDRRGTGAPRAHPLDDPMPTATCDGAGYLVEPFMLSQHFRREARGVKDPVPSITTVARVGLVEPFVLSQHAGGAPRSVDEPVPGMTCDGAHALIAPYYSSGSGETCSSVEHPLPTVTTKARFGMVMPITHADDHHIPRDVEQSPLPTVTGARELAFITASFGERNGQAARVRSVEDPAPTICAQGHVNLIEPGRDFDILFRMLEPHELAAAMGFDTDEARYEFAGTKTDVIKQIGNAVPVNTASALVRALMRTPQPRKGGAPPGKGGRKKSGTKTGGGRS
jgi:DNA (cytosine-5)-methyltransferase 1